MLFVVGFSVFLCGFCVLFCVVFGGFCWVLVRCWDCWLWWRWDVCVWCFGVEGGLATRTRTRARAQNTKQNQKGRSRGLWCACDRGRRKGQTAVRGGSKAKATHASRPAWDPPTHPTPINPLVCPHSQNTLANKTKHHHHTQREPHKHNTHTTQHNNTKKRHRTRSYGWPVASAVTKDR